MIMRRAMLLRLPQRLVRSAGVTTATGRRALSSATSTASSSGSQDGDNSVTAIANLTAQEAFERFEGILGFRQYPHTFPITHSFKEYQQQYDALEPKARESQDAVALAGRIVSIRAASKKLVFIDIQSNGTTVQVLSEVKHFEGSSPDSDEDAVKDEFQKVHESLRRGDIIGVRGFPGKSGKGELSIIPRQVEVLAPCLQPFPNSKYGIKEPVSSISLAPVVVMQDLSLPVLLCLNRKSGSARSTWTC